MHNKFICSSYPEILKNNVLEPIQDILWSNNWIKQNKVEEVLQYIQSPMLNIKIKDVKKEGKIKILNIEGMSMGILGALKVIQYIEEKTGKPVSHLVDYMVCQSSGSLVGTMLNVKKDQFSNEPLYSASDLLKMPECFFSTDSLSISEFCTLSCCGRLNRLQLDYLSKILPSIKEMRLTDLIVPIITASISQSINDPHDVIYHVFSSIQAQQDSKYNYNLLDVIRCVIAVPAISPSQVLDNRKHLDAALAGVSNLGAGLSEILSYEQRNLDDFIIISLDSWISYKNMAKFFQNPTIKGMESNIWHLNRLDNNGNKKLLYKTLFKYYYSMEVDKPIHKKYIFEP